MSLPKINSPVNSVRTFLGYVDPTLRVGLGSQISPKGLLNLGSGGVVAAGQPAFNTGTGIYAGSPYGIPVMSVGSPLAGFTWDGKTFTVTGNMTITGGAVAGSLGISVGGAVYSGETAYAVGQGFWIGTSAGGAPQFSIQDQNGNFINISVTGSNVLAISSSGIAGVLTSKQTDDQGWSQQAIWLNITGTPTTYQAYGITNVQPLIAGAAGANYVLQRDNGGAIYCAPKYGQELQLFTAQIQGAGLANFTANAYSQCGSTVVIPKPTIATSVSGIIRFGATSSAGSPTFGYKVQYSTDGGTTWTDGVIDSIVTSTVGVVSTISIANFTSGTGDTQIRLMGKNTSALNTISVNLVYATISTLPTPNYYLIAGAVSSQIPATAAGNCTATYPTTTCAATCNVTVTPGGGTPPYTYLWSVVSGTGTITAGSTAQTCTISDTETATTGGATFNTVVKCKVTDSLSANATSANCTDTNTFTLVYSAVSATVSVTGGSCSSGTCGNTCTASGTATANATGGNGSYTYSWSVVSGPGTITAGSTSQTCTVQDTEVTTAAPGTKHATVVQCSVNDTRGTGATTPQGSVSLRFSCPAP